MAAIICYSEGMWQEKDRQLYKKYVFKDFVEALEFINQVGDIAERRQHHPEITNSWNTVELRLSTHEEGGKITGKDHELAQEIDALFKTETAENVVQKTTEMKLYCDGGSRGNPGPSASGYVLMNHNDTVIKKSGVYLGITTNNQAEYQSLKFGMEEARKLGAHTLDVFMDSMLVVNQMKGIFKVKNRDLWPIHESIKELSNQFKKVTYTHVPRELNKLADAEVNETLDAELKK